MNKDTKRAAELREKTLPLGLVLPGEGGGRSVDLQPLVCVHDEGPNSLVVTATLGNCEALGEHGAGVAPRGSKGINDLRGTALATMSPRPPSIPKKPALALTNPPS